MVERLSNRKLTSWRFVVTELKSVEITNIEQASSSALKVNWEQTCEENVVELYRSTSEAGEFYLVGTYPHDKNYAIINGQKTGKIYYYKVRVVKKDDVSVVSEFSEIKSGAHYYQIYRAKGSGAEFKKLITLSKNKRDYLLPRDHVINTYYKIRGYKKYDDGNVYSKFSNIVKVKRSF